MNLTRRSLLATATASLLVPRPRAAEPFRLRYVLASSLYGKLPLAEVLPQVKATGAEAIDLWPAPHGSQREEIDARGEEAFRTQLAAAGVRVEIITRYDLGPFKLDAEIALAARLGARTLVCGGAGPAGLKGEALRTAVRTFAEKMKPVVARAEQAGVTLAIENHGKNLINEPDSLRWLLESLPSPRLGIAFAPYHLPQDPVLLAGLIREFGPRLALFYAWQHGKGSMGAQPKEDELLQLPGRGSLDFRPLLAALREIAFTGPVEIFMHPFPRGIPILPTAAESTAELNRARAHLEGLL